jgi:hypothetical protein
VSLTCDRVSRCEEGAGHDGPCSHIAPFDALVRAIEQWQADPRLQRTHSLEAWIREELRVAREALA